jgi:hypothetical protein
MQRDKLDNSDEERAQTHIGDDDIHTFTFNDLSLNDRQL